MPTLGEIARLLNADVSDQPGRSVRGLSSLEQAGGEDLTYINAERLMKSFRRTRAAAAIVPTGLKLPVPLPCPVIAVADVEAAVTRVLELFAPPVPPPGDGIDPRAVVDPTAELGAGVMVGPLAVIGKRCRIGGGTHIYSGVQIMDDVVVGKDCRFFPNVVIRERITIGDRVIIHAGSVLGSDGFGYRWDGTRHQKVPQIGTVVVEDDVEIGSCVCIDRAKFATTRIGRGTKIDNLVQIGHNVNVGMHCIIVGQSGMAGSAKLGNGVVIGGQSAVRDHTTMGDGSVLAACSAVLENVPPGRVMSGYPAVPHRQSLRELAAIRRLPELVVQVRKLQDQISQLKGKESRRCDNSSGKA